MSDIYVLQYRGKSAISRVIKKFTRHYHSHTAIQLPDQTIVESWHRGGVTKVENASVNHTPDTQVDVYSVQVDFDQQTLINFLLDQVGKKYDMPTGFLTRSDKDADNNKWFCSELVAAAFEHVGSPLVNLPPHKISPRDIAGSVALEYRNSFYTVEQ